ncbi:sulfurtransferase [Halioxenophilus aromaticivorans]|uniref:Sulfurtransferase n=1 Tax=Halioxenophilus aromaticivorans TaxID=1306992 RepID=A0AAV3TW65_9ALTE
MYSTLISAQELNALPPHSVVIFDCRFDLQRPNAGREQYDKGHIPKAFYLDLNLDLSSWPSKAEGRHPLPNFTEFKEIMSQSGVLPDKQVVCYDDSGGCYAARAWWLIKALGVENVAVLNGGYSHWQELGFDADRRSPPPQTGKISAVEWMLPIVAAQEVHAMINSSERVLVDARESARFAGVAEPIDPYAGHIPSACNVYWKEGLNAEGGFASLQALQKRWQDYNPDNTVHYCGSGVTACFNVLSHTIASGKVPALYVGSWSQWCGLYPEQIAQCTEQSA